MFRLALLTADKTGKEISGEKRWSTSSICCHGLTSQEAGKNGLAAETRIGNSANNDRHMVRDDRLTVKQGASR
ncbi:hypothetical protein NPIL_420411 [Nephila pilipes]|nr:hypothetical protein NPIL_420411 [Nephila pilipes]